MRARIVSAAAYLPEKTLTNDMLAAMVDTNDEWIRTRTGIVERRMAEIPTWDMAARSAKDAVAKAGIAPGDIDMIIASTVTAEYRFPSIACIVQQEIGAENAFCFDVNAACSGFVYALDVARLYIESGRVKTALVCSSEALSRVTDYADRGSCILFGDGAASVVVQATQEGGILSSYLASFGGGGATLYGTANLSNTPFCEKFPDRFSPEGDGKIIMDGGEVYKFATRIMPVCLEKACAGAGIAVSELDIIIPHQANIRIINSVISKYKLDPEKVVVNINRYGNMSSASIPVCIAEAIADGRITKGKKVCLVGFGAGLTCGAALIDWA